jgi:hypothetical protein
MAKASLCRGDNHKLTLSDRRIISYLSHRSPLAEEITRDDNIDYRAMLAREHDSHIASPRFFVLEEEETGQSHRQTYEDFYGRIDRVRA